MHWAKIDVPRYLREKRARKSGRRLNRKRRSDALRVAHAAAFNAQFGEHSKIVEMMADGLPDPTPDAKRGMQFRLPEHFSVVDSPERALAALSKLAQLLRSRRVSSVFLDLNQLTQYDLAANGLLDVLVDELMTQARKTGRRIRWKGTYPLDPAHRRFFQAMGVIKRLKITHEYPAPDVAARLELFDERCKHYQRALKPREADRKARVTRQFADHMNRCLRHVGKELTGLGRSQLCSYVSEILDNAEQHAGMLDWSIQGYLDTQASVPMCEIAIFNFGRSIAQTLNDLPVDGYTRLQVQQYLDMHHKKGFFKKGWRKEDLFTLIALQGRVSSKNTSDDTTRGNGTVDLIEFFQKVHADCSSIADGSARMAIVSGSTYVLFDGKYQMAQNGATGGVIAFNASNSLNETPDVNYVRPLEGVSFPGTIIGIKFSLSGANSTVVTSVEVKT